MTTIIYDNNGKIWLTVDGQSETPIVNTLTCEIPSNKRVVAIDMNTNEPILEDKTDSPEYLIQKLTERISKVEVSQSNLEASQEIQDGAIEDIGEVLSEIIEE